jgi:DNA-binding helix-hairpin-helix protein with protein kinase domain
VSVTLPLALPLAVAHISELDLCLWSLLVSVAISSKLLAPAVIIVIAHTSAIFHTPSSRYK